jgi:multicomponent K+:H+ antiporter subunit G
MPPIVTEIFVTFLLLTGSFFLVVGSFGLAKLPSLIQRLHAPTKSTTLGVGGLLIASMIYAASQDRFSIHEVLITLFLFISAPVTAVMLAKARLLRSRDEARSLPPTGRPEGWATLARPEPPTVKDG